MANGDTRSICEQRAALLLGIDDRNGGDDIMAAIGEATEHSDGFGFIVRSTDHAIIVDARCVSTENDAT
jgi:hypothetical protein